MYKDRATALSKPVLSVFHNDQVVFFKVNKHVRYYIDLKVMSPCTARKETRRLWIFRSEQHGGRVGGRHQDLFPRAPLRLLEKHWDSLSPRQQGK